MDFADRCSVLVEEQPEKNSNRAGMARNTNRALVRTTDGNRCLVMTVWYRSDWAGADLDCVINGLNLRRFLRKERGDKELASAKPWLEESGDEEA